MQRLTRLIAIVGGMIVSCAPEEDRSIRMFAAGSSDDARRANKWSRDVAERVMREHDGAKQLSLIPYSSRNDTEPRTHAVFGDYDPARAEHFRLQWYLTRGGIPDAWETSRNLSTITVAVLDTGVAFEERTEKTKSRTRRFLPSPDLAGVQIVPGWDFINDDPHPNDDNQHGTFMASVIAARGGIAGVAPGVRIMPIKVLDEQRAGTERALVDGIRWAVRHGADIVSLSLSFPRDYEPSPGLRDAVRDAVRAGVVLVAAAGNEGGAWVSYPAAFPEVIAVAATRMRRAGHTGRYTDVLSGYSNFGDAVDILAPGGALDQDVNEDGHPDGILAMTHDPYDPTRFGYWFQIGTSPAAAIVSGVVAILLANGCPPSQVRNVLRASARSVDLEGVLEDDHVGLMDASAAVRVAATLHAATTHAASAARMRKK